MKKEQDELTQIRIRLDAILALINMTVAAEIDKKHGLKTEVLLAQLGISSKDVAMITGKKEDAIRKAIQRSKK